MSSVLTVRVPHSPPASEEERHFREYIFALSGRCKFETYHGEYTGNFVFADKPSPDDDEEGQVRMSIYVESTYLWYRIRVYPAMFELYREGLFKEMARDMMHEHCHLFLDPVEKLFMWDASASQRQHYRDTIERQTQRICNTVMSLLPDGWYLPENLLRETKRSEFETKEPVSETKQPEAETKQPEAETSPGGPHAE